MALLCLLLTACKKDASRTNQPKNSHPLKFAVSGLASNTYCTLIIRDENEKILFEPAVSNRDTTYSFGVVTGGQIFKINVLFFTAGSDVSPGLLAVNYNGLNIDTFNSSSKGAMQTVTIP